MLSSWVFSLLRVDAFGRTGASSYWTQRSGTRLHSRRRLRADLTAERWPIQNKKCLRAMLLGGGSNLAARRAAPGIGSLLPLGRPRQPASGAGSPFLDDFARCDNEPCYLPRHSGLSCAAICHDILDFPARVLANSDGLRPRNPTRRRSGLIGESW